MLVDEIPVIQEKRSKRGEVSEVTLRPNKGEEFKQAQIRVI
jgi:hypothetical protein